MLPIPTLILLRDLFSCLFQIKIYVKLDLKLHFHELKYWNYLENSRQHHLSAEDIYKTLLEQGEDVGLATVYRVLTQFEAAGIIQRHHFENNHSVFEIMQEDHHDHIVCQNCNKVVEFTNDVIEHEQHQVAKKFGFQLNRSLT